MALPSAISLGVYSTISNASSFKNEPGANAFRAREMVNSKPAEYARPAEGVLMERRMTTGRHQLNLVGQPNFAGIDERQAAESFAAAVIHFDPHTLARAAGRDVETARLWKAGRRAPNSASIINMSRTIQEVQDWVNGEIESRKPHVPVDARAGNAALAMLQREAMEAGERGAMARAMLAKLSRGE